MADITLTTQELQLALDSLADGFGEFAKILDKSGSATTEVSTRKQKQDEEAIKKVKETTANYDSLTKAQQDNLLSYQKQLDILKKQNESIEVLTREQNKSIEAQQRQNKQKQAEADQTRNQGSQITNAFSSMTSTSGLLSIAHGKLADAASSSAAGATAVGVAFLGLNKLLEYGTLTFDQWVASLDQAFQSQLRYNTAVALGADGMEKANMQAIDRMRFDAQQSRERSTFFKNLTMSLIPVGIGLVALGVKATIAGTLIMGMTGPIGIIVGLFGLAAAGFAAKAAIEERAAGEASEAASVRLENQSRLQDMLYKSFNDLGDASMTGAGGMTELAENAHKAGFAIKDIDKFTGILKNSAGNISMFGTTAVDGAKNFAEVTGKMTDEFGMHFRKLGMSAEVQAASVEKYMSLQARLGLLQGKTQAEQAAGAAKYLDELDKTATMLGQTRKEQEDSRAAIMAIEQGQAALMDAEARGDTNRVEELKRAIMTSSSLQKTDPKVAAGLMKLVSSQGAVSDDDTRRALQSIPQTLEAVRRGTGTEFSRNRGAMSELGGTYRRTAGNFAATGTDMGLTGGFYGAWLKQEARFAEADKEAAKQGLKPGTPEYEKFVDDLATRKEATDEESEKQLAIRKKQQDDSIAMDKKLLSGIDDFKSSVSTFGEAVNSFVKYTSPGAKLNPSFKDVTAQAKATHGVSRESAAMPIDASQNVPPRPTDKMKQQIWDSRYAKGWNADGTAKNAGSSAKAEDLLIFGGDSGSKSNFDGLNSDVKDKVLAAAAEYSSLTGGSKLQINSANRSPEEQKRLYAETESLGTPGYKNGVPVAYPGTSRHESGRAVDIQNYSDAKAVAAMNKQGLYQDVKDDKPHFQPRAMLGGVFNGPASGYSVTLDRREAVVPMPEPSSKLSIEKEPLSSVLADNSVSTSTSTTINGMMSDMFEMMASKMDDMIDRLDRGNNYSDKLVKAMA